MGLKSVGNLAHNDDSEDVSEHDSAKIRTDLHSIKGGGQGSGKPQGNLSSVPTGPTSGPSVPSAAQSEPSAQAGGRHLNAVPDLPPDQPAPNQAGDAPGSNPDGTSSQPQSQNQQPTPDNKAGNNKAAAKPAETPKSNEPFTPRMRTRDERDQLLGHNQKPGLKGSESPTQPKAGATHSQPSAKTSNNKPSPSKNQQASPRSGFVGGLASKYGAAKGYAGKHKKGLGIGATIGLMLSTLVMGFFALLPLKIEAMMKAVYGEQFDRVEHAMERRAEKMVIKYALQGALNPEGGIVATGNPLGDLYKTWRVQQLEGKLFENEGLKISQGSSRHSIRVTLDDGTHEFSSSDEFEQYLDRDIKGRDARQFVKAAVRNQTKWYQWNKRRHLRSWIAKAYNLCKVGRPCWAFFKGDEKPEDTKKNFETDLGKAQSEGYQQRLPDAINCIASGEGCPEDTPPAEDPDTVREPAAEDQQVGDAAGKAIGEAAEEVPSTEVSKTLGKKLTAVFSSKAIPIIGWIGFAAHLDDFIWNERYVGVVNGLRKTQYADTFATWAKIDEQIKDGNAENGKKVTAQQVNEALKKLDTMEKSRAFQELFMGKSAGADVPSDKTLVEKGSYFSQNYHIAMFAQHYALTAYLHTLGAIVDLIGDGVGFIIGLIPGIHSVEEWIAGQFTDMLTWMIGPIITGKDLGAAIANAVRVGADIIANEFTENDLGGVAITPKTERETMDVIAQERREAPISLRDRLFSASDPSSFISRLAVTLPSSPMIVVRNGFDSMLAILANPLSAASGGFQLAFDSATDAQTIAAGGPVDRWGVKQFGFTEAMLKTDINLKDLQTAADKAKEAGRTIDQIRPEDCPNAGEGQPNFCKIDIRTIQSLKAGYTNTDDGGFNSDPIRNE